MSAEILETVYLRCDGKSFSGYRCQNKFGYGARTPAEPAALHGLATNAKSKGWTVDVYSEGLKGYKADAYCPEHQKTDGES